MQKILIVDDEELIREGLKQLLEMNGYQVSLAIDGRDAIFQMASNIPELVITDIIMPETDGIELILEIKKENPQVKIIAISGGGRINAEDHLEIARQFGVHATLMKPFSTTELLETIDKVLHN